VLQPDSERLRRRDLCRSDQRCQGESETESQPNCKNLARRLIGGNSSRGDSPFHAERDLSIDVGSMLLVASRDVPDQRAGRKVMPDSE